MRTVAALVRTMDLPSFREPIEAREGNAGRDATDPALPVSLWLYANIRGIGSARGLDRQCKAGRPSQWPCGGVGVNYHALDDEAIVGGDVDRHPGTTRIGVHDAGSSRDQAERTGVEDDRSCHG